jgi:CMP/dCMP kinase
MIISISGKPGAGKTTVSHILAQRLGWGEYYMGQIRRDIAKKKGMTIQEYNKLGETDSSTDVEVEKYQKELGKTKDNFIIQGRVSFKFIPHSFKVYLDVEFGRGAERVWKNIQEHPEKRNEGTYHSLDEVKKALRERLKSDSRRYLKYYGVDCYDTKHYDLVIDTTTKSAEEIAEEIIRIIETRKI